MQNSTITHYKLEKICIFAGVKPKYIQINDKANIGRRMAAFAFFYVDGSVTQQPDYSAEEPTLYAYTISTSTKNLREELGTPKLSGTTN